MSHIPVDRLKALASDTVYYFNNDEYAHIQTCVDCLKKWISAVGKNTDEKAANE